MLGLLGLDFTNESIFTYNPSGLISGLILEAGVLSSNV
jgi:hypothetical protein